MAGGGSLDITPTRRAGNRALVLVQEAIAPEALDRPTFETRLGEARAGAERAAEDSEERARALRDIRRYETFLAIAQ